MHRIFFIASFILCLPVLGLNVSMDVQPRILSLTESATLTITVEGSGNSAPPDLPDPDGFRVTGRSSQTRMSIENGTRKVTFTHQFGLVPLRTGTFTIGPFRLDSGGARADLPAVQVEVVANAQGVDARPPLRASLKANPGSVYHQQVFDLILSVYTLGVNIDQQIGVNFDQTGLKISNLQEIQGGREQIDGQLYSVRRWVGKATPLRAGRFEINPRVQVGLIVERQRSQDPFGDPFFSGFFNRNEVRVVDVPIDPLTLDVKEWPTEGRPESFNGVVGQFDFDVTVTPREVTAGEPVNLQYRISGSGNLPVVAPPALLLRDTFRVYEVKPSGDELDASGSAGTRRFEQVVIPRYASITSIPEIVFTFLNPASGTYETIRKGPFALRVQASSNEATRIVRGEEVAALSNDRQILGSDIGYLKAIPDEFNHAWYPTWASSPVFFSGIAFPPILWGSAALMVALRRKSDADPSRRRKARAPRAARSALAAAARSIDAKDSAAALEHLWNAMRDYFSDRMNLQPGECTSESILAYLRSQNMPAAMIDDVRKAFARCEEWRFGAATGMNESAQHELMKDITRILASVEASR